ncbi:MAG: glutaredoxin 3 [Gammaproteobacteria bacterium]|nr:glutaredoxin 3 [Gammaproteobacteria bacterium]
MIEVYSSQFCGYCVHAKMLLQTRGLEFEEIRVDKEPERRHEMIERGGQRTVPQIFIHGRPIGGFSELRQLDASGRLDELLGTDEETRQ